MHPIHATLAASTLCAILASCGGGGGGSDTPPVATTTTDTGQPVPPPVTTDTTPEPAPPRIPPEAGTPQPSPEPAPTAPPATETPPPPAAENPPPAAPPPTTEPGATPTPPAEEGPTPAPVFAAALQSAPADRATLSGTITVTLTGSGIRNAELLPRGGYAPTFGTATVAPDNTSATITLDTTTLPDGRLDPIRASAFNQPPGTSGASEIIVMPPRTWYVDNIPGDSCATYATINQLPDGRPALLDGSPATVRYCEPDAWPTTGMPPDCECIRYQ